MPMDEEKETDPVAGSVDRELKECDATEVNVAEFSKIILFRDEHIFLSFLEGNDHLVPIYGVREYERKMLPNVFVAAFKKKERQEG